MNFKSLLCVMWVLAVGVAAGRAEAQMTIGFSVMATNDLSPARIVCCEDMRTDLNEVLRAFKEIHPAPFWSRSEAKIQGDINRIVAATHGRGMTLGNFFKAVAGVVISFDDPHCWAITPGWAAYRDGGGHFFPCELRIRETRATVIVSADPQALPPDSEILAINGVPMRALIREFRPLTGQMDDPFGDEFLSTFFSRYLWFFKGWHDDFHVKIRAGKSERDVIIGGLSQTDYDAAISKIRPPDSLAFKVLGHGIGLLTFSKCDSREKTIALADAIFPEMERSGIRHLIVDARNNTGGGDDAWIALLEYLTDKPFSGYHGGLYIASKRLKELLGKDEFIRGYSPDGWAAPDGTVISHRTDGPDDLITPRTNGIKFHGDWVVLAGTRTFSSGMSFISAVKAYKLAPVIGQETGGRVEGFGQFVKVQLPRTGLLVNVSTKQFDGAVDVPYRRGVPPDIAVKENAGQTAAASDATLSAAIHYFKH